MATTRLDYQGTTPLAVIEALASTLRSWNPRETWFHQALLRNTDQGYSPQPFYSCMRAMEAVLEAADPDFDGLLRYERDERSSEHVVPGVVLEAIELVCRDAAILAR